MKNYILLLIVVSTIVSCKKKKAQAEAFAEVSQDTTHYSSLVVIVSQRCGTLSAQKSPYAGVTVQNVNTPSMTYSSLTDVSGTYVIPKLVAGKYEIYMIDTIISKNCNNEIVSARIVVDIPWNQGFNSKYTLQK